MERFVRMELFDLKLFYNHERLQSENACFILETIELSYYFIRVF